MLVLLSFLIHKCFRSCSGEAENPFRTVGTVSISYSELKAGQVLGLVAKDRRRVWTIGPNGLESYPSQKYNFGWSHGKEKLESGKFDTYNPVLDVPTTDVSLIQCIGCSAEYGVEGEKSRTSFLFGCPSIGGGHEIGCHSSHVPNASPVRSPPRKFGAPILQISQLMHIASVMKLQQWETIFLPHL